MRRINTLQPNVYRERAKKDYTMRSGCFKTSQRNVLFGPLRNLVEMFLAQLPFRIETEIDPEKMRVLFEAQKPGLIKCERNIWLWVRRKPFEKWVRQNATRICRTKKQMRQAMQRLNEEYNNDGMLEDSRWKYFKDKDWELVLEEKWP